MRKYLKLALILFITVSPVIVLASELATSPSSAPMSSSSNSQDAECSDLKPGQSRLVSDDDKSSPTGVSRHYRVTGGANPGQADVDLNINFLPTSYGQKETFGTGNVSQTAADMMSKAYVQKANQCFAQYKDRLVDSGGERLTVRVMSDPDSREVPPNLVFVGTPATRASSTVWTTKIDCPTIIHESLHLAGLVDTYIEPEKNDKGQARFDCRHAEPKDKLMNDQHEALDDRVEVRTCVCVSSVCENETFHADTSATSSACPPLHVDLGAQNMSAHSSQAWQDFLKKSKGSIVKVKTLPSTPGAPLTRAEMMTISKPRCTSQNVYMQCAQNAYRSSYDPGGCADTPPACHDGSWAK